MKSYAKSTIKSIRVIKKRQKCYHLLTQDGQEMSYAESQYNYTAVCFLVLQVTQLI